MSHIHCSKAQVCRLSWRGCESSRKVEVSALTRSPRCGQDSFGLNGAAAAFAFNLLILFLACVGIICASSRAVWSMSRDRGFPLAKLYVLSKAWRSGASANTSRLPGSAASTRNSKCPSTPSPCRPSSPLSSASFTSDRRSSSTPSSKCVPLSDSRGEMPR